eukprot:1191710-Prorocentrum_minimum.AAC.2
MLRRVSCTESKLGANASIITSSYMFNISYWTAFCSMLTLELARSIRRDLEPAIAVPQWEYTLPADQSHSLNRNIPHPPTNRSPSMGIYLTC